MSGSLSAVALLWSLLCAGLLIICNVLTKLSLSDGKSWLMIPVYVGAAAAYWVFRKVADLTGLTRGEATIGSLITLLTVGIGVFVLRESISVKQAIGLVLIGIGILLLT